MAEILTTTLSKGGRRASANLAELLRTEITEGRITAGKYLPTERQLAAVHGIARMTVRRALKALEAEGLVTTEPRHGYRVLPCATDPERGIPVAYVVGSQLSTRTYTSYHQSILNAFSQAAGLRGWTFRTVHRRGREANEVMEDLHAAQVGGAVLDTADPELLDVVRKANIPAVMVDTIVEGAPFDMILQDNYRGAFLATRHLLERGHRRIGWFGPIRESGHSRERYAGAVAGLIEQNLELPRDMRFEVPHSEDYATLRKRAAELLDAPNRPTGILALWSPPTLALLAEAQTRGMVLGRDYDVVGWSAIEQYRSFNERATAHGAVPATVVWSLDHMARMAISRLGERRKDLYLPPVRINVPTRVLPMDTSSRS